jgi:hypothetical protein
VDVWVTVVHVRVVQDAEGNVACAAGHVEDSLRLAEGCGCARVEGGDEVVSAGREREREREVSW